MRQRQDPKRWRDIDIEKQNRDTQRILETREAETVRQ